MKAALLALNIFLLSTQNVMANPACPICTVAIGASLEVARRMGVADAIVGLWAGALLALLGYWLIVWFDKKNWHFKGRNFILMASSIGMIGFIYLKDMIYSPQPIFFLYMDSFLFSTLLGFFIFIYSQKFYQWMKMHNGGRAHFPFEKVVLPLVLLAIGSAYLTYYPPFVTF